MAVASFRYESGLNTEKSSSEKVMEWDEVSLTQMSGYVA